MSAIQHHGVKGMHWGVRKSSQEIARDRVKAYYTQQAKNAGKKAKSLTTAQAYNKYKQQSMNDYKKANTALRSAKTKTQYQNAKATLQQIKNSNPNVGKMLSSKQARNGLILAAGLGLTVGGVAYYKHRQNKKAAQADESIQHYGILGMHWGIRRFQDKNGRRTAAGKKRYDEDGKRDGVDSKTSNKKTKGKTEDSTDKKKGLSDESKAKLKKYAKIGAGVAVVAVAAYVGYKVYKNRSASNVIEKAEDLVKGADLNSKVKKVGFKTLDKTPSLEEVVKAVNPSGSQNNCSGCVASALARLSGSKLNVSAKANINNGKGYSFEKLCKMFGEDISLGSNENVVKVGTGRNLDALNRQIQRKMKNGVFKKGDIGAVKAQMSQRYGGNPHTFYWVIDEAGKVIFSDGQSGLNDCEFNYINLGKIDTSAELMACKLANRYEKLSEATIEKITELVE